MPVVPLMKGIATFVPGVRRLANRRAGGPASARYCYSVWLRHLVVVICTPPTTHRPVAFQAMASDAHVLIDKSTALSGSECDEMIAVSQRQGRKALPRRSRRDRADPEYLKDAGRCPQTRGLCCRV
jgi:hypothetical protein